MALAGAIDAWTAIGLTERHETLDQQGLAIAESQEQSADGREALKHVIREFKAVPAEERPAKVGGVIRAFQVRSNVSNGRGGGLAVSYMATSHPRNFPLRAG